jgi:hypothetical protein
MKMKTKSKSRVFASKSLRKKPVVQATAAVLLAYWQMHDIDGDVKEDDTVPQVDWSGCFKALGIPDDDPREGHVNDVITNLAFDMQEVLIARGLLQKDCAWKLQKKRAA